MRISSRFRSVKKGGVQGETAERMVERRLELGEVVWIGKRAYERVSAQHTGGHTEARTAQLVAGHSGLDDLIEPFVLQQG